MTGESEGGGASRSTDPAYGTSAATDVSLREHLELQVRYTEKALAYESRYHEAEIRHLRELQEYKAEAVALAVRLQATEYERRLEDLNHAHAEAQRVLNTYAPRESVDQQISAVTSKLEGAQKNFDEYKETTNRALILREGQSKGIGMSVGLVLTALGGIATILTIIAILVALTR